jgi:hypothetical protein
MKHGNKLPGYRLRAQAYPKSSEVFSLSWKNAKITGRGRRNKSTNSLGGHKDVFG